MQQSSKEMKISEDFCEPSVLLEKMYLAQSVSMYSMKNFESFGQIEKVIKSINMQIKLTKNTIILRIFFLGIHLYHIIY